MGYKALKRTRSFLGKTEGFESKEERNFEKAHLKAYLRGAKIFYHGYEGSATGRMRVSHDVQQQLSTRK